MWLGLRALADAAAADAAATSNLPLYIAGGIAAAATVLAAFLAMRGTFKTADVAREAALDAAVDKDRQHLRDDNERLRALVETRTQERDDARERLARLRLAVLTKLNRDPDTL